jgi:threonine synthase
LKTVMYHSTNNKKERVNFETALMNGLASNYGLYMISRNHIPQILPESIKAMKNMSYAEIAFEVLNLFLGAEVGTSDLRTMLDDAYDDMVIPTTMQHMTGKTHIMWLTQGPTYSFKDYAARFFGRMLNYFLKKSGKKRIVAVATSGDTGGGAQTRCIVWKVLTILYFSLKDPLPNANGVR